MAERISVSHGDMESIHICDITHITWRSSAIDRHRIARREGPCPLFMIFHEWMMLK